MKKAAAIAAMMVVCIGAAIAQKGETLIGTPVYYDQYGNPKGSPVPADSTYHLPAHHYLNHHSAGDKFNKYFFEMEGTYWRQSAYVGFNFTYLPNRWGVYGSTLFSARGMGLSCGAALRLSGEDNLLDWHLYGGAVWNHDAGVEAGIRMALPATDDNRFCWLSTSAGLAFVDGRNYLTVGLSIELLPIIALDGLLFW